MVAVNYHQKKITLEEFLELPETKPYSEYINGEIEPKIMPQGEHSTLQIELASAINQKGKAKKLVYALPELRCTFRGCSIVPDIAVFNYDRLPKTETGKIANKFNIQPDWIIEILSPEQSTNKVIKKIIFCLKQGTKISWLIDPQDESVMIFKPDQLPDIKTDDEILPVLENLENLENWQLTAKEIFDWLSI